MDRSGTAAEQKLLYANNNYYQLQNNEFYPQI